MSVAEVDVPVSGSKSGIASSGSPDVASESGGGDDHWIVTCDLTHPEVSSAEDVGDLPEAIAACLLGSDPLLSLDGDRIVVSLTVIGNVLTATPKAVEKLWTALEDCSAEGWTISRATQVSYADFDHAKYKGVPIELLCASECADVLEVSKQRVSQLVDAGDFPPPDAVVGGRPSWRRTTMEAFRAVRRAVRS